MSGFYAYVKSTIDTIGVEITNTIQPQLPGVNLQHINLDATRGVKEVLSSTDPAIVWQLASLKGNPRAPLYTAVFLMGAKTTDDVSNQLMSLLVTAVFDALPEGKIIPIRNYSDQGPVADEGTLFIQNSGVEEQEFENQSGIRMLPIIGAVIEGFQ